MNLPLLSSTNVVTGCVISLFVHASPSLLNVEIQLRAIVPVLILHRIKGGIEGTQWLNSNAQGLAINQALQHGVSNRKVRLPTIPLGDRPIDDHLGIQHV